ncbi:MAG: beta-N-acetylhexosaminidase [Armatimonadota bacterium]
MTPQDLLLIPTPKEIALNGGALKLPSRGYILLTSDAPELLFPGARKLKKALPDDWKITASPAAAATASPIVLECDPRSPRGPEGYRLSVRADGITITAAAPAGVYYGACTLLQLLRRHPKEMPLVTIDDWPDFATRGVMLDVSRDKVPTLETLAGIVDLLSEWKINHFELYTEHTFEYIGHEVVWRNASPITGADILALDRYCAERFVELVPNQNSFGHLARWLKHAKYRALAELPKSPNSLNPQDPRSIELLADMYDQLLPHFTSNDFNVGCDETHDLGKGRSKALCEKAGVGRVYLDFLLKVHKLVTERGRRMLFWGDIIKKHPDLIGELPKDVVVLEWGYGPDYSFTPNCEKHAAAGVEFWVCPGTGTWNSFVGRSANAIQNPANAAKEGLATGAAGYLNTDWGDNGHMQFLPVSFMGYMMGAACSWNASADNTNVKRLTDALSAFAFRDRAGVMGQVAYDLADSYRKIAKQVPNSTLPFWLVVPGRFAPEQLLEGVNADELEAVIQAVRDAAGRMKAARMEGPDADLIKAEFACDAKLVELGCRIGKMHLEAASGKNVRRERRSIAKQLRDAVDDYVWIWLSRNRPGGLEDSVGRLYTTLDLLEQ